MAISAVGSLATSTGVATLSVDPVTVGDILVLAYRDVADFSLSTVSGGGVTNWFVSASTIEAAAYVSAIAWGVVTTAGSSTITITNSGATYTNSALGCQEFSGGAKGSWSQDGLFGANSGVSATGTYPSLTPTNTGELYVGALTTSSSSTGATSGYTYDNNFESDASFVYGLNAGSPSAPSASQASSGDWAASALLLEFTSPIYPVGTLASGHGVATLSVNPVNVGDVLVLFYTAVGVADTLSTVSGGGVTTWQVSSGIANGANASAIAWGVVTTAGSATITITNSGAAYTGVGLGCQEFSASQAGTWAQDGSFATGSGTLAGSGNYPSLTPANTGELYVGAMMTRTDAPTGAGTSGCFYINNYLSGSVNYASCVWDANIPNTSALAPAVSTGGSAAYAADSALLRFTPAFGLPRPVVVDQAVKRASFR